MIGNALTKLGKPKKPANILFYTKIIQFEEQHSIWSRIKCIDREANQKKKKIKSVEFRSI